MEQFFIDLWSQLVNRDWIIRILALVFPVISVFIYNRIPILIKKFRIHALNASLKYGINLGHYVITIYLSLAISVIILLVSILFTRLTENPYYLCLLVIVPFLFGLIYLLYKFKRKRTEGLVGLIESDFSSVANVELEESFNLLIDPNESFEKRKPIKDASIIQEKCNIISLYYDALKEKVRNDTKVNHSLFYVRVDPNKDEVINIFDYFKDLYSPDMIQKHIELVDKKRSNDNTINFIGDKIGISGFLFDEENQLHLHAYKTDHFTWKVFKDIYKSDAVKYIMKQIIRNVNIANRNEQNYLIASLKFLFSSFGIDIIVHGLTANGKRGMLVGLRNGGIEAKGDSKLHVPVNESFSSTDREEGDSSQYSLYECARRGIEEELGIRRSLIPKECIKFYDFAIVTDEGEIGLGCQVDLSPIMPLEQSRMYPGQDKFLELKNLLIIPYLPFVWDSRKYPKLVYQLTDNDVFCTPWASFTPLLYQRIVVRNHTWSTGTIKLMKTITCFVFMVILYICFYDGDKLRSALLAFFSSSIIPIIWEFLRYIWRLLIVSMKTIKYSYFSPLISQWGSEVAVLQSTANNIPREGNPIFTNIIFGVSSSTDSSSSPFDHSTDNQSDNSSHNNLDNISLKQLELVGPPYCSARSALVFDNAECPIGFYHVRRVADQVNIESNRLHFKVVPFLTIDDSNYLLYFQVRIQDEKISYHFSTEINESDYPKLKRTETTKDKLDEYSKLYSIKDSVIRSLELFELPESFKSRFRPFDLFYYHNNYYWSLDYNNPQNEGWLENLRNNKSNHIDICLKTDLYQIIKGKHLCETTHFLLKGSPQDLVDCLSRFITNQMNLKRIPPLEIYMLQLSLMRRGSSPEGIVLADKKKSRSSFLFR